MYFYTLAKHYACGTEYIPQSWKQYWHSHSSKEKSNNGSVNNDIVFIITKQSKLNGSRYDSFGDLYNFII